MGDFAPVRQKRRPPALMKFWRRNAASILTAVGLLAAAGGALATLSQPPVPVFIEANAVHIGAAVLTHPADNGGVATGTLYSGAAAFILVVNADGSEKASAVEDVHSSLSKGVCTMAAPTATGVTEHCSFTLGSKSFTADDTLTFSQSGHWSRVYSDGTRTQIGVPTSGGVIPVPFPIGK